MKKEFQRGIYVLSDFEAGKAYVGATTHRDTRLPLHQNNLENNKHHNKHLQEAYNSGNRIEALFIPVSDDVNPFELEKVLIDEHRNSGVLYNVHRVAPPNMLGKKHTPETLEKIRQSSTGRKHSPETIEKIVSVHIGAKRSEEARAKMSAAKSGKEQSEKGKAASRANSALIMRAVTVNGVGYESITAASIATGIPEYSIRYRLNKFGPDTDIQL